MNYDDLLHNSRIVESRSPSNPVVAGRRTALKDLQHPGRVRRPRPTQKSGSFHTFTYSRAIRNWQTCGTIPIFEVPAGQPGAPAHTVRHICRSIDPYG